MPGFALRGRQGGKQTRFEFSPSIFGFLGSFLIKKSTFWGSIVPWHQILAMIWHVFISKKSICPDPLKMHRIEFSFFLRRVVLVCVCSLFVSRWQRGLCAPPFWETACLGLQHVLRQQGAGSPERTDWSDLRKFPSHTPILGGRGVPGQRHPRPPEQAACLQVVGLRPQLGGQGAAPGAE